MAHTLSARTPFGPNVRIALVTGVSLALLGAVTIVLPLQRLSAVPVHDIAAQTFPKFKPVQAAPAPEVAPEPSHDQLIAMTFDILQALSKEPISAGDQTFATQPAPKVVAVAETPATDPATAPITRVVRTTAITIKPVTPLVIAPPAPVVETTAVASELDVDKSVAAAEIAAEAPIVAEPAATPADPNLRIVAGDGVNVRSGPGKSKAKLFALPGGAEVTIGANERGWLEVTDAEGRTGWVYKDYLLSP